MKSNADCTEYIYAHIIKFDFATSEMTQAQC